MFHSHRGEVIGELQSLNLLEKLMVLHHWILFSLAIDAIAEAILFVDFCWAGAIRAQGCFPGT